MNLHANGIRLEVRDTATEAVDSAHARRPVVLLVIGLGLQLIDWPEPFVQSLVQGGYRVVCFDNRDVGLSTHLSHLRPPNLVWMALQLKMGLTPTPPYTLSDMAQDALGVLDALQIERAHVAGMSMGGMVAQRIALAAPQRVCSLTSMMSSSGARGLPGPQGPVLRAMMTPARGGGVEAIVEQHFRLFKMLESRIAPAADADLRAQIRRSVLRSSDPAGVLRQMAAIGCDTGRAALLGRIAAPSLVMHGKADPLLPYVCGEDTARRIPGARMLGNEGMGHDMSPVHFATMACEMLAHMGSVPQQAGGPA